MNSHADIQKRLAAYCGGEISAAEKAEIEAHLASCTLCRIHLTEMQTTLRLLKSTPEVEAPVWMKSRIMARLREEQATRRTWLQRIWFPLHTGMPVKVLALLVMCVSGYYLSRSVDTELKMARQQQLQEQPSSPANSADRPASQPQPQPQIQPPSQIPSDMVEKRGQNTSPLTTPRREVPSVAPQPTLPAAPAPPVTTAPPASPPAYAPAPPAAKGLSVGKSETMKAAPSSESFNRASEAAPELKQKARRRVEESAPATADHAAGAPAGVAHPPAIFQLQVYDPEHAPQLIRQAVYRSGGSIIDDQTHRRVTLRIPTHRQRELSERLESIGRITARPSTVPSGPESTVTIAW